MTPIRILLSCTLLLLWPIAPRGQQGDREKWDVSAPTGPASTVSFETTEGTWMNLDVSRDGKTLVFDLLGDLYSMPADGAGATATRLTSGAAFDMQPRFSPDGKSIAFISDRGGLFNVWVADVNGDNPRQVSREQQWWINSPTWSPDGQYIYARRHFVGERSLGAGEIWMFHVSGSEAFRSPNDRASRRMLVSRPSLLMAGSSTTAGTCLPDPTSITTAIRTGSSTRFTRAT